MSSTITRTRRHARMIAQADAARRRAQAIDPHSYAVCDGCGKLAACTTDLLCGSCVAWVGGYSGALDLARKVALAATF